MTWPRLYKHLMSNDSDSCKLDFLKQNMLNCLLLDGQVFKLPSYGIGKLGPPRQAGGVGGVTTGGAIPLFNRQWLPS